MRFKSLELRQFRNIQSPHLVFNPGLNVFRGQNGQGKTNVVEALYLLTHGRSFRTSRSSDLINKNTPQGFFLGTQIEKSEITHHVEIKVEKNNRALSVNNHRSSTAKLRQMFSCLLFSPESLLIVKEAAQKRRDLVDDLCLSLFPGFEPVYREYKKTLKQKNSLLKSLKDGKIDSVQGQKINNSLTEILLQKGAKLTAYRLHAIEEISPLLLEDFLKIMDDHYGNIAIEYIISDRVFTSPNEEAILNAMYKRWKELKGRELASGAALVGPHKHDIQFNFNGQEARFFCSQGQQRTIILAFKMAQTRLHYRAHKEFPVLLLDDVLSELDKGKQMRFVKYLLSTEAQIFLTTTDATAIPDIAERSIFSVREGVFEESERVLTGGLSV